MTPALRKLTITAHVAFSVGWLGAVAAFLVLSIAGLASHDAEVVRGAYLSMDLISRFIVIPDVFRCGGDWTSPGARHPMGLVSVLLDRAEIRAGHFCHPRPAGASIRRSGGGGEARIRGCGRNIIQCRPRFPEDRTRARS